MTFDKQAIALDTEFPEFADWNELGRRIRDAVNRAVESRPLAASVRGQVSAMRHDAHREGGDR